MLRPFPFAFVLWSPGRSNLAAIVHGSMLGCLDAAERDIPIFPGGATELRTNKIVPRGHWTSGFAALASGFAFRMNPIGGLQMDLKLKTVLFLAAAGVALAGCSDTDTTLATAGDQGPNPGIDPAPEPTDPGPDPMPMEPAGPCPEGTNDITVLGQDQCELTGTITDDVTLTAGNFYLLNSPVFVGVDDGAEGGAGDPAVLTIEPGVTIYGADPQSFLVVSRGSQIIADGTATDPIIFTSAEDLGFASAFGRTQRNIFTGPVTEDPNTAEWGGLVLNGRAPLNVGLEAEGEGDSGLYGGNDPEDGSGILRFVQVKYAGNRVSNDDELNGLAFQGTGSGTLVENVQVHNGQDDGIEWFGGTTDGKNLIVTGAGDDSLDWTQGWSGRVQFAIVIQNPSQPEGADRGIEGDNLDQLNDNLPRATPTFSNATFIGGAPDVGDTGIVLRRGTAGDYSNIVISNFRDASFDIDDQSTYDQVAAGNLTLRSTLAGNVTVADALEGEDDDVANDLAGFFASDPNNIVTAPSLTGFFNGAAEQAVTAVDVSLEDDFFTPVDFIGAVNDDATNFTLGWTFGLDQELACPDVDGVTSIFEDGEEVACELSGTITQDLRLVAGLDYFLTGPVFIGVDAGSDPENPVPGANPAVLTVDAGVTVQGRDPQSFLVIARGSQIRANGTLSQPITFASEGFETASLNTTTSAWGGLVINGRAPLNVGLEAEGEGDSGLYGGVDPTDGSGSLRFVRVLFAGNRVSNDDELNGLAFQGTGSNTVVENVQVHNGQDDGIEWFGGTTNAKNIVVTGAGDDSLDWTQGWSGKVEFALVVQNPLQPEGADRGIEGDNLDELNDNLPRSAPQIGNATFVGGAPDVGDSGLVLRRGTAGNYFNFVVANFRDASLDIDDQATYNQVAAGALTVNSFFLGNLTVADALEGEDDDIANDLAGFFASDPNNTIGAETLTERTGGGVFYVNGDAENAVMAFDGTTFDPTFFTNNGFIGAVPTADNDFTQGWTVWLNQ